MCKCLAPSSLGRDNLTRFTLALRVLMRSFQRSAKPVFLDITRLLAFSPPSLPLSLHIPRKNDCAQILVTITASRRKPKLRCYDWGARYLPGTHRDYLYKKNFLNDFQRGKIPFFKNNIRHWHNKETCFQLLFLWNFAFKQKFFM